MEKLDRRDFLRQTALTGGALFGLEGLLARSAFAQSGPPPKKTVGDYGPLFDTPTVNTGERLLALPEGFQYTVIGVKGTPMSDGRITPAWHDGMAAFGQNGMVHLVRNHEGGGGTASSQAYGDKPYDVKALGGTTNLVVDPKTRLLVQDYSSLSGTVRNCAGGPTPWGTWITCEETTVTPVATNTYTKVHGYNFEVSASLVGEAEPVALKGMGRFSHEAVAVDPATGAIYETEDSNPSGFYRFLPNQPGTFNQPANLAAGGSLQMLRLKQASNYDTRRNQRMGRRLLATWVDIDNPDPQPGETSVLNQGRARGGALFARLEGCWYGNGAIYIVSTSGGNLGRGQVWEYRPVNPNQGLLTLIYESTDINRLDSPDNICVSPRGGLVLCEDGSGEEFVHGLTTRGQIFKFAKNIVPDNTGSEFAGATFSPDGETLFVNLQGPGMTFAIWPKPGYSWQDGAL